MTIKTASLVFFYFGEKSYMDRLAQEAVQLRKALQGYDKQVLLWHQTSFGPFELSQAAADLADVQDIPTKENLVKYLNELGDEGYVVDLYIFSHGSNKSFRVSKGTYGDNGKVGAKYLEDNVRPLKLRMVWGCNCYGSTLLTTWRNLGAKVCAGARYVNFYPNAFNNFVTRWLKEESFGTAVSRSVAGGEVREAEHELLLPDAVRGRPQGHEEHRLVVLRYSPRGRGEAYVPPQPDPSHRR